MYQSSTRTNFLDILADPKVIALLASIALHATIGASLPFFSQLEKDAKKSDPGTVKVVELTPNELQRIPQAPPIPTPKPITPPITPPSNPPISPNSPTIPFSPIRIPLEKITPQPPKGNKDQQAIPQRQPIAPIFDPNLSFKPTPKPTKPPVKKSVSTKPTPTPTPKPTAKPPKVLTEPASTPIDQPDDDGGDLPPKTSTATPNRQAQSPATKPSADTPKPTNPAQSQQSQSSDNAGEDQSSWVYGKYAAAASERIKQYLTAYPDIKLYKPQLLLQSYPVGAPCSKVKQSPFIVLMAAFDKVPENAENNPLGDSTAPSIDKPYVAAEKDTPDNRKLSELAVNTALYEANKADQNRTLADRGKRVLYQYRVQFDPTTCKK